MIEKDYEMIFDMSVCDYCKVSNICIKKRGFSKIEKLIEEAKISRNGSSTWPLKSYFNDDDISEVLPIRFSCPDKIVLHQSQKE